MILEIDSLKYKIEQNDFHYHFNTDNSITGVFGLSGAGKTTLFNLIAGVNTPTKGSIKLNNKTLYNSDQKINIKGKNRNIGYVFQENYLFPHLNVKKNLNYSKPYIKNRPEIVSYSDVIELLDISELLYKKPNQLSGGEKQRVAIGRALLSQPELLLLDEPFSNVDCSKRKQIISYLLRINNHFKIPLLIISHHLEDILKLTRKVVLVENKASIACGDIFNIVKNGDNPELIKTKKFQNTFKLNLVEYNNFQNKFILESNEGTKITVSNHSKLLTKSTLKESKIQLSLRPTDISVSLDKIKHTSIENQLSGTIKQIIKNKEGIFCVIDCGFELFVEISQSLINKLFLHEGQNIYCLIKANDFDIVHVYDKITTNKHDVLETSNTSSINQTIL